MSKSFVDGQLDVLKRYSDMVGAMVAQGVDSPSLKAINERLKYDMAEVTKHPGTQGKGNPAGKKTLADCTTQAEMVAYLNNESNLKKI